MNKKKELVIEKVGKSYSLPSKTGKLKVLDNISLYVEKGEIIAIVGPSGCGKSTILNIAAGFEKPDIGQVIFNDNPVKEPSPKRGVVFQSSVLFPWLSVKDNIAYGLKLKKEGREEINKKCNKYIQLVGLEGFENYYPNQLSGGMQQRVALARVLILEPRMLLMDEPFASLDSQTRMLMQQFLLSISMQISPTILFVTHDVEEALILADTVYIMSKLPGRIIKKINVPFKRPRSISIIGSSEFTKAKSEILELLFN